MDNKFTVEFADEAKEQANKLDNVRKNKFRNAIRIFQQVGVQYKNTNDLGDGLFELKPDDIRAYFEYYEGSVIIVGLVVLKKSQKAPQRFIEQARRNVKKYIKEYKS